MSAKLPARARPVHRIAQPKTPEWERWVAELEIWKGHEVCGAKKRDKSPCAMPPVSGKARCRMHGGASLEGSQCPSFKHGRHVGDRAKRRARLAGAMPEHLAKRYVEILANPDLLAQRPFMAAAETRIEELYASIRDKAGTVDQWLAVRALIGSAREKQRDGEEVDWEALVNDVERVAREWAQVEATYALINQEKGMFRLHSETEIKRLKEMQNSIPRQAAVVFSMTLRNIVVEELRAYPDIRSRIEARVLEAMGNQLGSYLAADGS